VEAIILNYWDQLDVPLLGPSPCAGKAGVDFSLSKPTTNTSIKNRHTACESLRCYLQCVVSSKILIVFASLAVNFIQCSCSSTQAATRAGVARVDSGDFIGR
jgi:hypothetical protein